MTLILHDFLPIFILGDPGAVGRVDKMFVVKVYSKIARLDLNFQHEHFIHSIVLKPTILLLGPIGLYSGWVWGQVIFWLFSRLDDIYTEPLLRAIFWENRESQDTRQEINFFIILPKHPI